MPDQSVIFSDIPYDGVERTDNPRYPIFAHLYRGMQARFWIPENISMADDKTKFKRLPQTAQQLFTMNLAWQIFADSDQGENLLYLAQRTNNIEVKRCITLQAAEESNHSGSYQYIISSMYDDPTAMLNDMEENINILKRRKDSTHTGQIVSAIRAPQQFHPAINMLALEGLSFTTSFITTLAVHQNFAGGLPGCKNQILKIAADEHGHIGIWSNILKILMSQHEVIAPHIIAKFQQTVESEMTWITTLNGVHPLPELSPSRVHRLLQLKANQLCLGLNIDLAFPDAGSTSSLMNWYTRAININSQSVEPQASDGLAYVAGEIEDDWS